MNLWAAHPGKAATERYWLAYTAVWGAVCGVVMLGGFAHHWGDLELMLLGVSLALGAVVGPILRRAPEERGLPFWQTAGFKLGLSVVGFAFFMNYSQTPFFFDVLHMHYGFRATWVVRQNPIFLYFLTVPYFATYAVLMLMAYRLARRCSARAHPAVGWVAVLPVPFAIALLETVLNANPFTTSLFCYDDMPLVLWFGTLVYGTSLALALPVWLAIDERPGTAVAWWLPVVWTAAAMYADVLFLDLYRYQLAPLVTTVVDGAQGLGDFQTGCLAPLP
jgi:cycloeucalenol cycloisomerase